MLVYLDQVTFCKVKSLLCHPEYHAAAMVFEGPPVMSGLGKEVSTNLGMGDRLQVGAAQISTASRKKVQRENIAVGVGEKWKGDALFRHATRLHILRD
jgi:hypothetical protein